MAKSKAKKGARVAGRSGSTKAAKRAPAKRPAPKKSSKRSSVGGKGGALEVARAVDLVVWSHSFTEKMIADFPEDKATFQGSPHDNHLVWTLGHMACTYAWLNGLIGGSPIKVPDSYNTLFGPGSKPNPDASAYPALADVRKQHDDAYAAFLSASRAMKPADAAKPPAAEAYGFAKTRLDALDKCVWHEGWHQGQLSTVRRALGLKGVM